MKKTILAVVFTSALLLSNAASACIAMFGPGIGCAVACVGLWELPEACIASANPNG